MRPVPAHMEAIWRSGQLVGADRPVARVTVQRPSMRLFNLTQKSTFTRLTPAPSGATSFTAYPAGINPERGESINTTYRDFIFNAPADPVEVPNVRSVRWTRTTEADVADCTIALSNSLPLPVGQAPRTRDLDLPGALTYTYGTSSFSSRWGHVANRFKNMLMPDNIVRTYEGYGSDWLGQPVDPDAPGYVPPEKDSRLLLTGVWLIDEVRMESGGELVLQCRDLGRLLLDHQHFAPIVPKDFYPAAFRGWDDASVTVRKKKTVSVTKRLKVSSPEASKGSDDEGGWHTVRRGDTLWDIAKKYYGAPTRWHQIYEHPENKARIDQRSARSGLPRCGSCGRAHWIFPGFKIFVPGMSSKTYPLSNAFADNSAYWLSQKYNSAGNFAWVQASAGRQTVSRVRVRTVKAGHVVAVHLLVGGSWVSGSRVNGAPSVGSARITSTGWHTITFDAVSRVEKVRISVSPMKPWDGGGYRAGIRGVEVYGPIKQTKIVASSVALAEGPAGSNPGFCSDYTDIVKLFCAWAGLYWPEGARVRHSDGTAARVGPQSYDRDVLGSKARGRVWGDFQDTGTYPVAEIGAAIFDKKTMMDGIAYIRDNLGFLFWIDETGAVQWRFPNVYSLGNWVSGTASNPGRTRQMYQLDERNVVLGLSALISSRSVREGVFVANPTGHFAALTGGYNPNPTGLMRMGGVTDVNYADKREARITASLIAIKQLFRYRTDTVRIVGFPGLQIDDQVRAFERTTSEGYVHYIKGISSSLDMQTGEYVYDLQTHWLGDDPDGRWVLETNTFGTEVQSFFVGVMNGLPDFNREGLEL